MRRRSLFLLPAGQLLGQGANATTVDASRYATLQAAIEVTPDHGVVQMPAGTYNALGGVTIRKNISLIGAGPERTLIDSTAGPGQAVIKYAPQTTAVGVEISGFSVNLANARQATALDVNNLIFPSVHHVKINLGAIGLLVSATGAGHFSDLTFENQDAAGVRVNGDAGAENHFTNIMISRSFPGVLQAGFEVARTTDADLGGMYLSQIRVNEIIGTGASIVNGFRLVSTFPNSQFYLSANQCIADAMSGGDAWLLKNVSDARLVNSWGANGAPKERGYAGIRIDNSAIVQISSSDFRSHSRDVSITGSANLVSFVNNRFAGEELGVHLDRVGTKTALMFLANRYNAVPTNDPEQLAGGAVLDPLSTSGITVWTRDDMGNAHTMRMINQSAGAINPTKHMRVNRNGHFEILNNAGNAPILTVDDEGNAFVKHLIVNGGSVEAKIEELRSIISGLEAKVKELTKEPTN